MTKLKGFDIESPLSGFGELSVAENNPFIQATAAYNLIPANFRSYTTTGGSVSAVTQEFRTAIDTTSGASAELKSFRSIKYKAGQGGLARFTGRFTPGVANSYQVVGALSPTDGFGFGYNGTEYGLLHRHGGENELRSLQITSGATGSENASVTIDGTLYTIPITSGTVQVNAHEIATYLNTNLSGWDVQATNDKVRILKRNAVAVVGAFSFSSATATGTWSQTTAGATPTNGWVARTAWNKWQFPDIVPLNGNVYQVSYQYLGYGVINYSVEDPITGQFRNVHRIQWANANTGTSITNPSLPIGMETASTGSTTALTTYSASMAGFTQGNELKTRNPRAYRNTKTSVTTTPTNIFTLRNRMDYGGRRNEVEIQPLFLTAFTDSAKGATIELRTQATVAGNHNFQENGTNLVSEIDTTGTTVSSDGRLLASIVIGSGDSAKIDLDSFRISIPPTLRLVISGRVNSGAAADITVGLTWYEDV